MHAVEPFEVHFANGKIVFAASLADAERMVAHEALDLGVHGLLPATILSRDSDVIGTGETLKTITAQELEESGLWRGPLRRPICTTKP